MTVELPLSPEDVNEIVAILDNSPYQRIDIRTARFSLQIVRSGAGWTQSWDHTPSITVPPAGALGDAAPAAQSSEPDAAPGWVAIRAQLPGTFYHAPQPGAAPFITVGSLVTADSVIGIIETMKLMTPVYAGVAGTVAAIRAANAEAVDAAAILVQIDPAAA